MKLQPRLALPQQLKTSQYGMRPTRTRKTSQAASPQEDGSVPMQSQFMQTPRADISNTVSRTLTARDSTVSCNDVETGPMPSASSNAARTSLRDCPSATAHPPPPLPA
ncbi:MAG: hypothetical protein WDW38_005278 [Sanguina aurantia]